MGGLRVVVVARGCVEQHAEMLGPGRILIVNGLGCGKLLAVVGPRGGLRLVVFKVGDKAYSLTPAVLRAFKPEEVYDKELYEKIISKAYKR